jgi:YgiT-type zinc finger domain-containing protein
MYNVKCYNCGSPMHEVKSEVTSTWGKFELTLKGITAFKCENCGETVFH